MSGSFKELIVWQKSIELVKEIYKITEEFPKSELYNPTTQIRRGLYQYHLILPRGKKEKPKKIFYNF